jgi:hypothetical protein
MTTTRITKFCVQLYNKLLDQIPVLEISMGDFGAYNDTLVTAIQNGKCEKWKREVYAPTPTMFSEFKALSRFSESALTSVSFFIPHRVNNQRRADDSGASASLADWAAGENDQQTEQRRPHVCRPEQLTALLGQLFSIFLDAVLRTCAEELL